MVLFLALVSWPQARQVTAALELAIAPQTSWFYVAAQQWEIVRLLLMINGPWFIALVSLLIRKKPNRWEKGLAAVCWLVPLAFVGAAGVYADHIAYHKGSHVRHRMEAVHQTLLLWAKEHHRFPKDEAELRQATAPLPSEPSPYGRGMDRLPYALVRIGSAIKPHIPNLPGPAPGTIYVAVSGDLQQAWVTGLRLDGLVGNAEFITRPVLSADLSQPTS